MPEEQAFCVLVKIMYEYGLRALYKNNFEDLHCKFYQLERLMQVSRATFHIFKSINGTLTGRTVCITPLSVCRFSFVCHVAVVHDLLPHSGLLLIWSLISFTLDRSL